MDIITMKKEDFEKVPFRNAETNLDDFYSAVIIPAEDMHDSGYRCMDFVAVNSSKEPICRLSGCSDVLDIDGIGGYGLNGVLSDKVDNKAWKIDCLPCGYLRIFARSGYKLQADSIPVSNFSLYAVKTVEDYEKPKILYVCEPDKNVKCKKPNCYINGGKCRLTSEEEFAKTNEIGSPIQVELDKWYERIIKGWLNE